VKAVAFPKDATASARMRWVAAGLVLVGFIARMAPFANQEGRLLRMFPTEDGYLMLTIARNIALGRGMSTADGTMPTNGTQPLATFLWSACSFIVGVNKVGTVILVLAIESVLASASAYLVYRFARRALPEGSPPEGAMLAGAGWYASATVVSHSMNCLESGLYVLFVGLVLVHVFRSTTSASSPRYAHWAAVGALLGAAFWARNDAVLFCLSIATVHLAWGLPGAPPRAIHRLAELTVAGAMVTAIASPWLVFNYTNFGHIIPVSGQAESMDAKFGANAALIAPNLFGYLTLLVPIPSELHREPGVVAACVLAIGFFGQLSWSFVHKSQSSAAKQAWLLGVATTVAFAAFYGLFFGAPHFMSRYLLALSPFYAAAWGESVRILWGRLERTGPQMAELPTIALLALPIGLNARNYRRITQDPHFQVVEWVSANVPDAVWVGAPQSGTVGYFHDRTINLDGKVNAAALLAQKKNQLARYIVDSPIEYIVDWESLALRVPYPGVTLTLAEPLLGETFDLLVDDKQCNLAVLKRKSR
jgi:hypothetical protein